MEKTVTNTEIRQWYMQRTAEIVELNEHWIRQGLSAQERAGAAWRIRHEARLTARSIMSNAAEVELLRARDLSKYGNTDGPTFEFLVDQLRQAGLTGDEVYEAIITGAYRTNEGINKSLGL